MITYLAAVVSSKPGTHPSSASLPRTELLGKLVSEPGPQMTLSVKVQLCPRPNLPFHPVRQLLVKSRRRETLQVDTSFDKLAFHPVFEEMTTYETNDLKDWKEFGGEKEECEETSLGCVH